MGKVPFFKPYFTENDAQAAAECINGGWVSPGKSGDEFASGLSKLAGTKYCRLTTSGTVALMLAAVDLSGEVLVPAYGIASTINALILMGLRPRLVDIDRVTGSITPDAVSDRTSYETQTVCFVDFAGYIGDDLIGVRDFCLERGFWLIEDAACALGNSWHGKGAGSFGDVGAFSFSAVKPITTGQGGAIVTSVEPMFNRALAFSDHGAGGWRKTRDYVAVGGNFRLSDIQAAVGLSQLDDFENRQARRRERFGVLDDGLDGMLFDVPGEDNLPLYHIVFTEQRDKLIEYLGERGIIAKSPYKTLCDHRPYANLRDSEFPNADWWTQHAVYLPFGPGQLISDMERIAHHVRRSGVELLSPSPR